MSRSSFAIHQGLSDLEVILRLEELGKGAPELAVSPVTGVVDFLAGDRLPAGVGKAGGEVAGHGVRALLVNASERLSVARFPC